MYRLTKNRLGFKAGTVVYRCTVYDMGLADWDSMNTGDVYISVSTNEDGTYPIFTVDVRDLEIIE